LTLIHKGRPLIDIPLTAGVGVAAVTALAAPVLAALGAIAALVTECTIEVEKVEDTPKDKKQ
jgi:phage-related minor tail protein